LGGGRSRDDSVPCPHSERRETDSGKDVHDMTAVRSDPLFSHCFDETAPLSLSATVVLCILLYILHLQTSLQDSLLYISFLSNNVL
jgi:hypothetical protein